MNRTEKNVIRKLQIKLVSEDAEDVQSYWILERAHKRMEISNV